MFENSLGRRGNHSGQRALVWATGLIYLTCT